MTNINHFIPIKNLFYLLCYAWDLAEQKDKIEVDAEYCDTYPALFAKLLASGCRKMFKYGLYRDYRNIDEEIIGVRGKIDIEKSLKNFHITYGKLFCNYDEYSYDVTINQIILATLRMLISYDGLDEQSRKLVKSVINDFPKVTNIKLSNESFSSVSYTSNNRFVSLLIHICRLIYNSLLPDEKTKGNYKFVNFTTEKMSSIFEKFLYNFYKRECHEDYPLVRRSIIDFKLTPLGNSPVKILPKMITDVTMTNKGENRQIILDAKYYVQTLVSRFEGKGAEKIRREHISQIIDYVINNEDEAQPYTLNTNGILVYPKVDKNFVLNYKIGKTNHLLRICTIDLNDDWHNIYTRLKEIINFT